MSWQVQGSDEIVIEAVPERIWEILEDTTRLPEWAPMVRHTSAQRESLGAVRECAVELEGRPGRVAERCVEFVPNRRIAWLMVEESFGFGRMFADQGFSFTLEPRGGGQTLVRNESYYRPKQVLAQVMSVVLMRGKFRHIRERVLLNLKRLAEETPVVSGTTQGGEEMGVAHATR